MNYVRQAERGSPPIAISLVALLVPVILAMTVALTTLDPFGFRIPASPVTGVSSHVLDSARHWEAQRNLQAGHFAPAIESAAQWELERRQLSEAFS